MIGLLLGLGMILAGCGSRRSTADDTVTSEEIQMDRIVVGFSQLGAESDWRSANTESMKSTFTKEAGYDLIFEDGHQKQANQIRAIRTFIQQEVDYIVLAPVTETGWDTVLREAKDAGIPVIIGRIQILHLMHRSDERRKQPNEQEREVKSRQSSGQEGEVR